MKANKGNGESMFVTFKDYIFLMLLENAGETAIMKGFAHIDSISAEMLKYYAEDTGKLQEKIDAITQSEDAIAFEAGKLILK